MGGNIYETQKLLDEYLLFHYGGEEEVASFPLLPRAALNFPVRTVAELLPDVSGRALDLGCATGRSSFELSRDCSEVLGIDYSSAFIGAAQAIQRGEEVAYSRLEEGHVCTRCTARVPKDARPKRVRFQVGDAMNLGEDLGVWDVVHAANLVCRLTEPEHFLQSLGRLVVPGGRLALTTPCTWLGEFTPPEKWPSGRTLDWLQEWLTAEFELVTSKDLPFLIRETARKFQLTNALGTVWRRKNQ